MSSRNMLKKLAGDGFLEILAIDHRGSMKELLDSEDENLIKDVKKGIVKTLSPHTSATLLDPIYGRDSFECVSGGLLISREKSGYIEGEGGRKKELLDKFPAEKIKAMGGSAVKLLVYYNPEDEARKHQERIVRKVSEECNKNDIPFLCEVILYDVDKNRNRVLVEVAKRISRLGIDILKTEAPTTLKYCKKLDEKIDVPWVILSGGLDFKDFLERVKMGCKAGASGYAGGRGIWKDCVGDNLKECLNNKCVPRIEKLNKIVEKYGKPIF